MELREKRIYNENYFFTFRTSTRLLEWMARTCDLNGFYTFCVCLGPYHVNFLIEE